jgi:hypothetical protein
MGLRMVDIVGMKSVQSERQGKEKELSIYNIISSFSIRKTGKRKGTFNLQLYQFLFFFSPTDSTHFIPTMSIIPIFA